MHRALLGGRIWLAVISALALFALLAHPRGAPASYPATDGRLLVKRESGFGFRTELVSMDERGKVRANLSASPGMNGGIAVSRQGTAFAYVAVLGELELPPGIPERFRRRLTRQPQAMLAFGTFLHNVIASAGGGFVVSVGSSMRVTPAVPGRPAWSRDSRRVVVAQAHLAKVNLYAYETGGLTRIRRVTESPGRDLNPRFSPDGRSIVFERHIAGEASLYSVNADGTKLRRLTYWSGDELSPDFSPDGESIVFSSNADGRFELYVMSLRDGSVRKLTSDTGNARRPAWSPDGRWIAFSSDRDGDSDVYLIDPTGKRERKLTRNASEDLVEDWQPLRDSASPRIRALPSSGPRGQAVRLRYVVRDGSAMVRVIGDVELRGATSEGISIGSAGKEVVVGTRSRRVRFLRIAYTDFTRPFGEDPVHPPGRFPFCVVAVDPYGNQSSVSCSTFRFR